MVAVDIGFDGIFDAAQKCMDGQEKNARRIFFRTALPKNIALCACLCSDKIRDIERGQIRYIANWHFYCRDLDDRPMCDSKKSFLLREMLGSFIIRI